MDNVQVDAEQERGLDVTLQAGGVQETVTVTGGAQLLQTENGDVAGTLGTVEVQRLPQIGRDPYELIRLTPGVFGLGARGPAATPSAFPTNRAPEARTSPFSRPRTRCRSARTDSAWRTTTSSSMASRP